MAGSTFATGPFAHNPMRQCTVDSEQYPIVPVTPQGNLVPQWWSDAYGPTRMYVSTMSKDKPDERRRILAAMQDTPESAKEWINRDLAMVGYTMSPASRVEDGEIHEWVRVVIHLEDGIDVAFGSLGIVKSLMLITQLDRPAPWQPPLVKRLTCKQLAGGKNWYALVDPPPSKTGAAKK